VEEIIAEGIEPASAFPFGPFPGDRLKYRSDRVVEYQTPRSQGLCSTLRPDDDSIRGVAVLVKGYLAVLELWLPQNLNDLAPTIMKQFVEEH
jgi:hypothetical protein